MDTMEREMAWLGQAFSNDDERRRAEAHSLGVPFVKLSHDDISLEALVLIPEPLSRSKNIIAYKVGSNGIEVALLDMADLESVEFLRAHHHVRARLTDKSSIKQALLKYQKHLKEKFAGMVKQGKEAADSLLRHALHSGAHYVHLDPGHVEAAGMVVRYRINGALHEAMRLPEEVGRYVTESVKALAKLFPVTTTAQEGSFSIDHNGQRVGVRVVTTPTHRGERVTMRLSHAKKGTVGYSLETLGFWGKGLEVLHDVLNKKSGAIIVAGPNNSGKTTTLYTILDHFDHDVLSVATVEEKSQYTLPRVHQTAARPEIGLTLPAALKSVLKQDPDVVLVGDLAEGDAAVVALQAVRRRVKILGEVKAKSAAGVFDALYMHDVPALLAATTVGAVIAQRLVPRLCDNCKTTRTLSRAEAAVLEVQVNFAKVLSELKSEGVLEQHKQWKDVEVYTAEGCEECKDTPGVNGQLAVAEVMPISSTIASLIKSATGRAELESQAREEGMLTLLEDALCKSIKGDIAIESVIDLADKA
jgi:type IV pilus assembly protein PilB